MATPPQINSDNCALHGDSAENEVDSDLPHLILTFLSVSEAILVQEVAGAIGIPNMDTFVSKFLSVGAALNEPQQLLNNAAPEHALCSQQGEAWWGKNQKKQRRIKKTEASTREMDHGAVNISRTVGLIN